MKDKLFQRALSFVVRSQSVACCARGLHGKLAMPHVAVQIFSAYRSQYFINCRSLCKLI
jgi:hypothetical protein